MTVTWPVGWFRIDDPDHIRLFTEELAREVGDGHVLKGITAIPIARADGSDDYLFQLADGRVADVHLTFANHPERPPWPGTTIFDSLAAWQEAVSS